MDENADLQVPSNSGITPLCTAVSVGDMKIVKLLINAGAYMNTSSIIRSVARGNNLEMMELFLNSGVGTPKEHINSLFTSSTFGYTNSVEALINYGVDANIERKNVCH